MRLHALQIFLNNFGIVQSINVLHGIEWLNPMMMQLHWQQLMFTLANTTNHFNCFVIIHLMLLQFLMDITRLWQGCVRCEIVVFDLDRFLCRLNVYQSVSHLKDQYAT